MTAKVSPSGTESNLVQERSSNAVEAKEPVGEGLEQMSFKNHMSMNDEIKWIKNNIKMRKCLSYIPSEETNICQCGYSKEKHTRNFERQQNGSHKHIDTEPTNAFGEIQFNNFGGNIAKFVRVDSKTDMSTILNLMTKVWRMRKPGLLISVAGGDNDFEMKSPLREACLRGLMKAVQGTGAWLITGGTHAGVTKYVGKVVKEYRMISTDKQPISAIGITPWGIIHKKHQLENKKESWPVEYCIEKQLNREESLLDPNHSHFLLVDNGNQHKFATEIDFRKNLESEISKMPIGTGNDAMLVPVVLLVLEWGKGTLKMVQNALEKKTPVVILKVSDRDTDSSERRPEIPQDLAKSNLVHICEWNEGSSNFDIDDAIHKALLKANQMDKMYKLKLALAWNRIDTAKSKIFTDDNELPTDSLDDIMLSAIRLDRVEFVELLLDNGVILKKFLTKQRLQELYNDIVNGVAHALVQFQSMSNHLSQTERSVGLLKKHFKGFTGQDERIEKSKGQNINISLTDCNETWYICFQMPKKNQVDCIVGSLKCDLSNILKDVGDLIQYLLRDCNLELYSDQICARGNVDEVCNTKWENGRENVKKPDFKNPCLDLFIWSVLNNRQDMAQLFWRHGKDAIATALLAHALFSAMLHKTEDRELKAQIDKNRGEFTECAIGVLRECHSANERETRHLLIRLLSRWWKTSCVLIAVKANNKEFIYHTACQDLFNNIWMGGMTQENGTLRLLICVAIPPLVPLLAKFKGKDDSVQKKQKSEQSPHKSGTNKSQTSQQTQDTGDDSGDETEVDGKSLSIGEKFVSFYRAPVVVFFHTVISYMVFLGLYSYILISKLDEKMSVEEIILIVWVVTILTQEVRQVFTTASMTMKTKLLSYITDGWNILDVVTISLFVIGMILRNIDHSQTLEAARVFLGVNLITFFLRLLPIFSVHKVLGPKLVMIIRMVHNLVYFGVILMVFIVAYAIASHAILYPSTELSLDTLIQIFRRPYWNIYGELMLEEVEGAKDCTNVAELYRSGTYSRCPTESGKYFVPVLMGLYMFMCNILLLNLLIAIFGHTFQMVQEKTEMHWCFQRYSLINEYYIRPSLAPPLILFEHVYYLIRFIKTKLRDCRKSESSPSGNNAPGKNAFLQEFKEKHVLELCRFEDVMANNFHRKIKLPHLESNNHSCRRIADSLSEHHIGAR